MAEETKQAGTPETDAAVETPAPEASPETAAEHAAAPTGEDSLLQSELDAAKQELTAAEDKYLRSGGRV